MRQKTLNKLEMSALVKEYYTTHGTKPDASKLKLGDKELVHYLKKANAEKKTLEEVVKDRDEAVASKLTKKK